MEEKKKEDKFEELWDEIGTFGKYHLRVYGSASIICLLGGMIFLASSVLTSGSPNFKCITAPMIKTLVNESCEENWSAYQENLTIPWNENTQSHDHCYQYNLEPVLIPVNCSYWHPKTDQNTSTVDVNFTFSKCSSWAYEDAVFYSTVESDFDLICDDKWKSQFSKLLLMAGFLVGALISGFLSDRIGRKNTFLVCAVMLCCSAIASSFTTTYWQYGFLEMCVGGSYIGLSLSAYILVMECICSRNRVLIGTTFMGLFSIALMLLSFFGYLIRSWRTVLQVTSVPLLITTLIFRRILFESPRWLHATGRHSEAEEVVTKILKICNLKELKMRKKETETMVEKEHEDDDIKYSTNDILKNCTMLKTTLLLCYNWLAVTCVYYGLTLNSSSLAGSVLLNLFLSGVAELPAYLISALMLRRCGRRTFMFLCHFISGAALVSMSAVPKDIIWLNILLSLVGKFGAAAAFSCIYVYTSELYPTPFRCSGMGCCSCCARLGGMLSMPIFMLMNVSPVLPYVAFGVIALLAGILICLLPETKGLPLPETVEECETNYKTRSFSFSWKCQ